MPAGPRRAPPVRARAESLRVACCDPPSEKRGYAQVDLEVVRLLALAEQVAVEREIAHRQVSCQPVRDEQTHAGAERHGEVVVATETRAACPGGQVERARHRALPAEEDFSG